MEIEYRKLSEKELDVFIEMRINKTLPDYYCKRMTKKGRTSRTF